jgi:hypothetical protein
MLYFPTIRHFQHCKAPNIERLEQMRRVSRHIERDDLFVLTVSLKIGRVVAFVTIEDQKTIATI